jgi:hypothetical protein
MIIEFSVALLEQLKLTPNEFFVVTLIKHKEFDLLLTFLRTNYTKEESEKTFAKLIQLKYLTSTSYLENSYDFSRCKIGNELYSLLKTDDIFEEFLETYPSSVIRTDGVLDYLRTDQKTCRMLYLKITRDSSAVHQHILKCLNFEIEKRKREGSMKFMVRMSKWLTTEAWKSYEDEINKTTVNRVEYGTDLE